MTTALQGAPALHIGDTAPNFAAQTTEGPISFHEWLVHCQGKIGTFRLCESSRGCAIVSRLILSNIDRLTIAQPRGFGIA